MSVRRKSRECALQMLFQWEMARSEPWRIESGFWKSVRAAPSTRAFANGLFEGAVGQAEENDRTISTLSKNWRVERIAEIDLNILRLAMFEIRFGKTPPKVVINEALELAKKFSTEDSARFLNGILDAFLKSQPLAKP